MFSLPYVHPCSLSQLLPGHITGVRLICFMNLLSVLIGYIRFFFFFVGVENNRMRCPMGSIAFCVLRTALEMMSRIIGFMKPVCLCVCGFCTHTQKPLADLRVVCDCS